MKLVSNAPRLRLVLGRSVSSQRQRVSDVTAFPAFDAGGIPKVALPVPTRIDSARSCQTAPVMSLHHRTRPQAWHQHVQGVPPPRAVYQRKIYATATLEATSPAPSVPKSPTPDEPFKTIIEPFRIKFVEALKITDRAHRLQLLEQASYNLFKVPAEYCLIDLLTDSGPKLFFLKPPHCLMASKPFCL